MKRCLLLLPVLLGLLLLLLPVGTAQACACCDGRIKRSPVAWSAAGDEVLVHLVDRSSCRRRYAVEHWRVGESSPSGCRDLLEDPSLVVPCSELKDGNLGENAASTPVAIEDFVLPEGFVAPASLSAPPVRLGGKVEQRAKDPSAGTTRSGAGVVEIRGRDGWLPLWQGTVTQMDSYPPNNSGPHPMPMTIALWPSPVGRRALLTIDNNYSGNSWVTTLVWVELPKPESSP